MFRVAARPLSTVPLPPFPRRVSLPQSPSLTPFSEQWTTELVTVSRTPVSCSAMTSTGDSAFLCPTYSRKMFSSFRYGAQSDISALASTSLESLISLGFTPRNRDSGFFQSTFFTLPLIIPVLPRLPQSSETRDRLDAFNGRFPSLCRLIIRGGAVLHHFSGGPSVGYLGAVIVVYHLGPNGRCSLPIHTDDRRYSLHLPLRSSDQVSATTTFFGSKEDIFSDVISASDCVGVTRNDGPHSVVVLNEGPDPGHRIMVNVAFKAVDGRTL